jgi:hypothetical protein
MIVYFATDNILMITLRQVDPVGQSRAISRSANLIDYVWLSSQSSDFTYDST